MAGGRATGARRHRGFSTGGGQELGLYDGSDGVTCVLFRRFGSEEAVLLDRCLPRQGPDDGPIVMAEVATEFHGGQPHRYLVVAARGPATSFACRNASGESCQPGHAIFGFDRGGSGLSVGAPFATTTTVAPGETIEVIVSDGDREVGRRTVTVPTG